MKYYSSPRWSNEFLDCSVPMTFDTYNLCSYQCLYCFSYYQRSHYKDYIEKNVRFVNVEKVKKIFLEPDSSQFGEFVKLRKPLQWGGLSEPFDLLDKKFGVTLELLKFFREIDYPVAFSTKSVWFLKDPRYVEVIRGAKNFHFKVSIITLDAEKAKRIELGVPSPADRLWALHELSQLDTAGVNLRLRPFLIGVTDPTHLDLIREAVKNGAQAVTTEFFCLEARANFNLKKRYKEMSRVTGFDIWEFYRMHSKQSGYRRLNYEVKRRFVIEMEKLCRELGIGFFVSDAHHKERCDSGSCCGLPNNWNFARCQFTEALQIAKEKGKVQFKDILRYPHNFLNVEWGKAEGLNSNSTLVRVKNSNRSLLEVMRTAWNSPQKGVSPYKYFDGILIPAGLDENKDIIYKFNQKKYEGNHSK